MLSSRNLAIEGLRKLAQRWLGPFEVTERIGGTAYRLCLTGRFEALHPVFHVSLLRPWTGHLPQLPPPVLVEGEPEWEVEQIVGHRETRRGTRYTVRFRGYGAEEDLGLYKEDLGHCWDLVQ